MERDSWPKGVPGAARRLAFSLCGWIMRADDFAKLCGLGHSGGSHSAGVGSIGSQIGSQ